MPSPNPMDPREREELTVGSLFSGIGGLELGLERAGMQTVWQVEKDDYCRRVLAKHWPDAQRFDDVCTVGAHNLSPVDVICGGFPCQDISTAGRGAGIAEGTRSGLWFEYRRIIRELRPRYVVVENVAALLARGIDRVLGDLAESGYDAEWDCIPASAVGAPHRRDRLFLVAYANRQSVRKQPIAIHGGRGASVARDNGAQEYVADSDGGGCQPGERNILARESHTSGSGAHLADTSSERRGEARQLRCDRPTDGLSGSGTDVSHAPSAGLEGRHQSEAARRTLALTSGRYRAEYAPHWEVEPGICRVVDGVQDWAHRIRALGNAVVPQVAEYVGRLIVSHHSQLRKAA